MVINTCSCRASAICLNFKWPLIWQICCRLQPPTYRPWRCGRIYRVFTLKRPELEGEEWKGMWVILGRKKKEWYCNHTLPCPLPQLTIYYHIASEMFPKLGILLLLYKACINFFFSLFSKAIQDQNHSVLVGISDMLPFLQLQISGLLHSLEVTRW